MRLQELPRLVFWSAGHIWLWDRCVLYSRPTTVRDGLSPGGKWHSRAEILNISQVLTFGGLDGRSLDVKAHCWAEESSEIDP